MESVVCRSHLHHTPPLLSLRPRPAPRTPSTFKPHSPLKALTPLRSSRNPPIPSPLSSAAATLAAAAALLSLRLHHPSPSFAAAPPPVAAQSETLTDTDKERTLESQLDSNPDDIRALRALMELKVKSARFPEAIAIVDRLILLEPDEKDLPLLRAHLQSYSGDTDSAKQGFEALLAQDPFLVEAYHGLVMTTSQTDEGEIENILHRVEAAMEACRKEKRKEDVRDFKLLLAQIRVIEGKYEEALKVYQELVKEEPRDFRPYLCQGIIYTLMRKKEEAEKQFQKYRRLVPKGHPYAQYFDDNMIAMKVFSQVDENKRQAAAALKS